MLELISTCRVGSLCVSGLILMRTIDRSWLLPVGKMVKCQKSQPSDDVKARCAVNTGGASKGEVSM